MESLSQVSNSQILLMGQNEAGIRFGSQPLLANIEGGLSNPNSRPFVLDRTDAIPHPLLLGVLPETINGLLPQNQLGMNADYANSQQVETPNNLPILHGAAGPSEPFTPQFGFMQGATGSFQISPENCWESWSSDSSYGSPPPGCSISSLLDTPSGDPSDRGSTGSKREGERI
ncbi:hypothetical protein R1flu_002873 [Riccia fluitans]|uniref:Uncharacterized protein n=1 Tax=Riccia fluitans TaxID=41844 RepID=A0ABD1Y7K6_9MARC